MQEIRKIVVELQHKINDLLDKPNSSAARQLQKEVQALEDDLQVGCNARSIGDRVERVIRLLEHEAEREQIMDYNDIQWLIHQFEHIHDSLRKLY
jgi:hypothetical protein